MMAVLFLFLTPFGGGIPAGVLLARAKGLDWQTMTSLYFISDVILALVFEPCVLLLVRIGKHKPAVAHALARLRKITDQTILNFGLKTGPFSLIMLSFGVDPMTGRTAAFSAGHGFVSGWMLAIAGDMIFFSVIMVSTLFLNNILGDGTWTAIIIMTVMIVIPSLIRKYTAGKKQQPDLIDQK